MLAIRLFVRGRLLKAHHVKDVASARHVLESYRDGHGGFGVGVSVLRGAEIYGDDGAVIGWMSYNGRLWANKATLIELNDDLTPKKKEGQ
jgi:hypothetical protein